MTWISKRYNQLNQNDPKLLKNMLRTLDIPCLIDKYHDHENLGYVFAC